MTLDHDWRYTTYIVVFLCVLYRYQECLGRHFTPFLGHSIRNTYFRICDHQSHQRGFLRSRPAPAALPLKMTSTESVCPVVLIVLLLSSKISDRTGPGITETIPIPQPA
jgi:hypothetical protein